MVSLIIPVFNRSDLILNTLKTIDAQTFEDWECIIVDDHSTDHTIEVIGNYIDGESRFKLFINSRTKGAQGARNIGLEKANGDLVVFFDSDNLMKPTFLREMVDQITSTKTDIVTCLSEYRDAEGENFLKKSRQALGDIRLNILNSKSYVDFNSSMVKKSKLFEIGMLDEDCPAFQEWDTHIRLSRISKYSAIAKELVVYRFEGDDSISKSEKRAVEGYYYILKKHQNLFRSESGVMRNRVYVLIQRIINVKDFRFRLKYFQLAFKLYPNSWFMIVKQMLISHWQML